MFHLIKSENNKGGYIFKASTEVKIFPSLRDFFLDFRKRHFHPYNEITTKDSILNSVCWADI